MGELSGVGLSAIAVGSVMIYGGITGKSPLAALQSVIKGTDPRTNAQTAALSTFTTPTSEASSFDESVGTSDSATITGVGASAINAFLKTKGLSKAARAGILGNIQVESGFSPTASNPREGAIGICQWELGRRTNLQKWAAAHGGTETDLNMQLGFMWHELQTSKAPALLAVAGAPTARLAAAAWDSLFEVSSGEARTQREDNADAWYAKIT